MTLDEYKSLQVGDIMRVYYDKYFKIVVVKQVTPHYIYVDGLFHCDFYDLIHFSTIKLCALSFSNDKVLIRAKK